MVPRNMSHGASELQRPQFLRLLASRTSHGTLPDYQCEGLSPLIREMPNFVAYLPQTFEIRVWWSSYSLLLLIGATINADTVDGLLSSQPTCADKVSRSIYDYTRNRLICDELIPTSG